MSTATTAHIYQLLAPPRVRIQLTGCSKQKVIEQLITTLGGHSAVRSLDAVRKAILNREKMMSTGVGKLLGLPHAKTGAVTETIAAFATTGTPIDFGSIDDQPVRLLFLLVGPEEDKSRHIKILGRISRLVSRESMRQQLLDAETPKDVMDALKEGESKLRT